MNRHCLARGLALSFLVCSLGVAHAQNADHTSKAFAFRSITNDSFTSTSATTAKPIKMAAGQIIVPLSSVPPATQGTTLKTRLAQTNIQIYLPNGWQSDK